jgi:hypothetical protein
MSDIITPGHFGWAGPAAAKDAWDKIGHLFPRFMISGAGPDDSAGKRYALYELVRKVLPQDILNYAQATGDCFVAGSLVSLSDGSTACIEDVGIDEPIICGTGEVRSVKQSIQKSYNGEILQVSVKGMAAVSCTPDHRFVRSDGYLSAASTLSVGDPIRMAADPHVSGFSFAQVSGISRVTARTDVYCLEVDTQVEEERTFVVNGYVVSNCVSFGAKNAINYLQAIAIANNESGDPFHEVFPPYLYSTGRVLVGQGQMRGQAGSVGSWQAKAAELYGTLMADYPGCPKYSGAIADNWGDNAPSSDFLAAGKKHLVKTTAPVTSWDELRMALRNGYACTIASNQGFEYMARSDGFHAPSGSWPHQMCLTIIDDDPAEQYAGILNSWGDVHGRIKDFKTGALWPVGMLRVRRASIERMISSGECIAYSNWQGFPSRSLNWAAVI